MVPNCVAKPKGEKRSYVCDEIHNIKDISSLNLRRPIDRGYVVNWELQKEIWRGSLLCLHHSEPHSSVLLCYASLSPPPPPPPPPSDSVYTT